MLSLDIRLSTAQVMVMANNLHHDECGIEAMFTAMKQADNPRVAYMQRGSCPIYPRRAKGFISFHTMELPGVKGEVAEQGYLLNSRQVYSLYGFTKKL